MDAVTRTYVDRTPGSAARAERAAALFPGGDFRAAAWHRPYPLTIAGGAGPEFEGIAGRFPLFAPGGARRGERQCAGTADTLGGGCDERMLARKWRNWVGHDRISASQGCGMGVAGDSLD